MKAWPAHLLTLSLLLGGAWSLWQGGYIHAKAQLAQLLIASAWSHTLQGERKVRPWPWADTWPVACLDVPRLAIRRFVLAGASGSTLAFGPGQLFVPTPPQETIPTLIAGHRDTHFRFLKDLRPGDELRLQTADGRTTRYRIEDLLIADASDTALLQHDRDTSSLILITCYPFDALVPGGPLRYLVRARAIDETTPIKQGDTI